MTVAQAIYATQPFIRDIAPDDNCAVASVIRAVMTEHGATGEGFAIVDPEVECMFEAYQHPRARFYVIEQNGEVIGGGGLAPLKDAGDDICELQKFYFLPEARSIGFGRDILNRCLQDAKAFGYKRCYLETLGGMDSAVSLYTKNGFTPLSGPLGNTGHFKCNAWFIREIE